MKNQGELEIISYLNGKVFNQLNDNFKKAILKMFPFILNDDKITCCHHSNHQGKPDIIIKCRHSKYNVSLKSGHNPSIHEEYYLSFFDFLRKNGLSERSIQIIKFYHFGMSEKLSNNGVPFTKDEIISRFGEYLEQANKEINANKILVQNVIYRSVIKGAVSRRESIDFFYYGSVDNGFVLGIEDIYSLIFSERKNDRGPIHFGGLLYQPSGRKIDRIDRYYTRIKWPILTVKYYDEDII